MAIEAIVVAIPISEITTIVGRPPGIRDFFDLLGAGGQADGGSSKRKGANEETIIISISTS